MDKGNGRKGNKIKGKKKKRKGHLEECIGK